ncbi:hypothetical protein FXO37_26828 [Capsicum annuum]|nr:hypothetical protein FXO37_26828 [Capsicum annuum]
MIPCRFDSDFLIVWSQRSPSLKQLQQLLFSFPGYKKIDVIIFSSTACSAKEVERNVFCYPFFEIAFVAEENQDAIAALVSTLLVPQERKDSVALASPVLVVTSEGLLMIYSGLKPSLLEIAMTQGVYYYFYQVFKNKVKAITTADKKRGQGDGSAGMFSWLVCRLIHKQKGKLLRSYRFMNQELQDSGKELSNHQSLFLIPQFSS